MNYWARGSDQRLSRRRVLQASALAAGSSAILAACGSNGGSKPASDKSSLVSTPSDTDKIAKRGGVFKSFEPSDVSRGFEPYLRELTAATHVRKSYQSLAYQRPGRLEPVNDEVLDPDLAESWEYSPDKTELIFKIRQDSRFDPRAPTNGRKVETSDVAFSWQRFSSIATTRADLANSINPDAAVVSVQAPDTRTVVFKLAFPSQDVLLILAAEPAGNFAILPKEADTGFDVKQEQRGSGPWMMTEYAPAVKFVYSRNPGWWNTKYPFVDGWEMPIIPEYAQSLAQFKAGAVYHHAAIRQEDLLPTKKDVPELVMVQTDADGLSTMTGFGWQDGPNSPFRDERVRQAYSMSLDRDLFIDTFANVSKFRSEGLPIDAFWNNAAERISRPAWWLNPKDKSFGPNAKYLEHDIAGAKQLLSAAGFGNGFDANAYYITSNEYGTDFPKRVEVVLGMAAETGMRLKPTPVTYASVYRPKYYDAKGDFDGLMFTRKGASTARSNYVALYNHNGSLFNGFSAAGQPAFSGDPEIEALVTKISREFDQKTAVSMAHEVQRLETKRQYSPLFPGGATGFSLAWPVYGNFGYFRNDTLPGGGGSVKGLHAWLDDTKAPIKRA